MRDSPQLIAAIWSISEGRGSDDELTLLRADEEASLSLLDRLIIETEADLAVVRNLPGDERDQVVADFTETLARPPRHGCQVAARPGRAGRLGGRRLRLDRVRVRGSGRGSAAGLVVGRPGRGVGGRSGRGARRKRRPGHTAGGHRWARCRLATACRRCAPWRPPGRSCVDPDERRARDGWWRSAAATTSPASVPACRGSAGSRSKVCASRPAGQSCRASAFGGQPEGWAGRVDRSMGPRADRSRRQSTRSPRSMPGAVVAARRGRWSGHGHSGHQRGGRGDRQPERRAHGAARRAAERIAARRGRRHGARPHGRRVVQCPVGAGHRRWRGSWISGLVR